MPMLSDESKQYGFKINKGGNRPRLILRHRSRMKEDDYQMYDKLWLKSSRERSCI